MFCVVFRCLKIDKDKNKFLFIAFILVYINNIEIKKEKKFYRNSFIVLCGCIDLQPFSHNDKRNWIETTEERNIESPSWRKNTHSLTNTHKRKVKRRCAQANSYTHTKYSRIVFIFIHNIVFWVQRLFVSMK